MYGHPFIVDTSADNAIASSQEAAQPGRQHVVHAVHASFSATHAGLLEILDDGEVVVAQMVYDARDLVFPQGLNIGVGHAVTARLAASGVAGTIGYVTLIGTTV